MPSPSNCYLTRADAGKLLSIAHEVDAAKKSLSLACHDYKWTPALDATVRPDHACGADQRLQSPPLVPAKQGETTPVS